MTTEPTRPETAPAVPGSAGPLHGVRVLELGQLIAGSFCGQLLGDFGADVVKLEVPGEGDPMRRWGVVVDGRSLSWSVIARAPPMHSVTSCPVISRWTPPAWVPSAAWTAKNAFTSDRMRSNGRVL